MGEKRKAEPLVLLNKRKRFYRCIHPRLSIFDFSLGYIAALKKKYYYIRNATHESLRMTNRQKKKRKIQTKSSRTKADLKKSHYSHQKKNRYYFCLLCLLSSIWFFFLFFFSLSRSLYRFSKNSRMAPIQAVEATGRITAHIFLFCSLGENRVSVIKRRRVKKKKKEKVRLAKNGTTPARGAFFFFFSFPFVSRQNLIKNWV